MDDGSVIGSRLVVQKLRQSGVVTRADSAHIVRWLFAVGHEEGPVLLRSVHQWVLLHHRAVVVTHDLRGELGLGLVSPLKAMVAVLGLEELVGWLGPLTE